MMLNGQDITEDISPLEVPYSWLVDWNKDFAGKSALAAIRDQGIQEKTGRTCDDRTRHCASWL